MDRAGSVRKGKVAEMEQMHQRMVHLERIKKIKNRKPGGPGQIDTSAPHIIEAMLVNPRKVAKKLEFNKTTEQENKSLLQRISKVLTAPPTFTDEDYKKQKLLCPSTKGLREKYEEAIMQRHHTKFMENIKNMGAFYKPKQWEEDYKKSLKNGRFMRQVKYERPKGFVDIFAEDSAATAAQSKSKKNPRHLPHISTASNSLTTMTDNSSLLRPLLKKGSKPKTPATPTAFDSSSGNGSSFGRKAQRHSIFDSVSASRQPDTLHLAYISSRVDVREASQVYSIDVDVKVTLTDFTTLTISTISYGSSTKFNLDAEFNIHDVFALYGFEDGDDILTDTSRLEVFGAEVARFVEISADEGSGYALNLRVEDGGNQEDTEAEADVAEYAQEHFEEEDIVVTRGCTAWLKVNHLETRDQYLNKMSGRVTSTHVHPTLKEQVGVIVRAVWNPANADKAQVNVFFLTESYHKNKHKKAVLGQNTYMQAVIALPTVMLADMNLLRTYFENLASTIEITHEISDDTTSLHFS